MDLLADYVGGVLDGTPDESVVAGLVADDPGWRSAHATLTGGLAAVHDGLRALAAVPEPMPADVCARLDAALLHAAGSAGTGDAARLEAAAEPAGIGDTARLETAAGPVGATDSARLETAAEPAGATVTPINAARGATTRRAEGEPGSDGAAPDRRPVAVPSGTSRRRRLRWAAPIGIAAGVLAFLGFGIQQFDGTASEDTAASSAGAAADSAQRAPEPAAGKELAAPGAEPELTASGTDYRRGTLAQAGSRVMVAPALPDAEDNGSARKSASAPVPAPVRRDSPLGRLWNRDALLACIQAITAEHGAGPVIAQTVDLARYDGAPAVIVQFVSAGHTWVWASGPGCGTPELGADKLHAVQVG
jgi:hypothetical protein